MGICIQGRGEKIIQNNLKESDKKTLEVISTISDSNVDNYRQILDSFKVKVIIPEKLNLDDDISETCYIILNLLPRFLKMVKLEGDSSILERLPISHSSKINIGTDDWKADVTIVLGNEKKDGNSIYAGSSGWSVYISTKEPCKWNASKNKISAIYTGALAVGEVFKEFVNKVVPEIETVEKISHLEYDLVTHGKDKQPVTSPKLPEFIDIKSTLLAGCGAVGQAICYCLSKSGKLIGEIELVDHDIMDPSNEQRYLFGFEENRINPITRGPMLKVDVAKSILKESGLSLRIRSLAMQYEILARLEISDHKMMNVITALDKVRPRLLLQASLPQTLWNVWTDTGKNMLSYGIGKHSIDGPYECLSCEYFPKITDISEIELIASRTGFGVDQVKKRIETNNIVTPEDVVTISQNRKLSPIDIAQLNKVIGKTFNDLIHGNCGVFQLNVNEEHAPTPAPHIPVLAAAQLTTQFILSKIGQSDATIKSVGEFNALRWPDNNSIFVKLKRNDCICSDPDYITVFKEKWKLS